MGSLDTPAYILARKNKKSQVSGWRSVQLNEQTGLVTAVNNAGQTFRFQYPIPKDGKDGVDGKDGIDGLNGRDGLNGLDGLNGEDGVGIENIYADQEHMVYAELTDGRTVRIGYLPEGPQGPVGPQGLPGQDGIQGIQGPPGVQGPPGENAVAGLVPRGNYDEFEVYNKSDYVTDTEDNNNTYVCTSDTPTQGLSPHENLDHWQLLALAGAQGPQGPQGDPGPQGEPGPAGPVNVDTEMSDSSANPVSNATIKQYVDSHIPNIPIASKTQAGIIRVNDLYDVNVSEKGDIYPNSLSKEQYDRKSSYSFVSKGTLESVLNANFPKNGNEKKFLNEKRQFVEIETGALPFVDLKQRGNYLYEIQFDTTYPVDDSFPATFGACSTFVKDGKVYRNLDFDYTENTSFIVHTPKFKGMSFVDGLYNGKLNEWDMKKVAQLPNRVVDGINDAGLVVTTHLVFNDNLYTGYTGNDSIPIYQVPSLLLNNCTSIANIRTWLNNYGSKISIPRSMQEDEYTLIFFVKINNYVYSLQPFSGQYSLFDLSSQSIPKLTNFVSYGADTVNKSDSDLQTRPTGIERYNLIHKGATLEDLRFTKAYENPDRLSEFIGIDGTTKASTDQQLTVIYNEAKDIYDARTRDGQTWQTMHSVIYDPTDSSMVINVQENWTKTYKVPETGRGEGTTDYNDLINKPKINGTELVGNVTINTPNIDTFISDVSENPVQNKVIKEYVDSEIDEVKLTKFPNVTFIGSPTINGGQVRDFSASNYARFPFLVDLTDKSFEINFVILSGSNVATQQNILGSNFGLDFFIRNSRFVLSLSNNGTTWDIGETTGTNIVLPNTQYKIKISWDKSTYKVQVSTNGGQSYITDITKASALSLYPTQIFIGVREDNEQIQNSFSGMIDFTEANLLVDGVVRWVGLDVVGIDTRMARDMSNIDSAGEQKVLKIVDDLAGKIDADYDSSTGTLIFNGARTVKRELTEEHFTGDYLNGKPVFEKTFIYTTPSTNSGVAFSVEELNIDTLIEVSGTMIDSSNYYLVNGSLYSSPLGYGLYINNDGKTMNYQVTPTNQTRYFNRPALATLRYTKNN